MQKTVNARQPDNVAGRHCSGPPEQAPLYHPTVAPESFYTNAGEPGVFHYRCDAFPQ